MARLIAKSPLEGVLPLTVGRMTLSELVIERMTSVAPLRGQEKATAALLKQTLGLGFPAPNRTLAKDSTRILWAGRSMALLVGAEAPAGLDLHAALTDQSDAVAGLQLEGPGAEAALARLVPLDLRATAFKRGHTARTMLWHMTCQITRTGPQGFELFVMRSMARTATHDLHGAMKSVAAQV